MAINSLIYTHTSNSLGSSLFLPVVGNIPNPVHCCRNRSSNKLVSINGSSSDATHNSSSSLKGKNPIMLVLEAPQIIWKWTLQPMTDFGIGQRSIWEGGVGLFVVSGVALFALTLAWLRGF